MSFNIGSSMFTAENKYRTPSEKMQRELMIKREAINQQNKITNEISERAMMQYEAEKELAELRRIIAIKQTQNEIYLEEEEKKKTLDYVLQQAKEEDVIKSDIVYKIRYFERMQAKTNRELENLKKKLIEKEALRNSQIQAKIEAENEAGRKELAKKKAEMEIELIKQKMEIKKTEQKKKVEEEKKKIMEMKLENMRKKIAIKQAERNNFVERQKQMFEKQKNEMNKEIYNLNRLLSIKQENYKHVESSLKKSINSLNTTAQHKTKIYNDIQKDKIIKLKEDNKTEEKYIDIIKNQISKKKKMNNVFFNKIVCFVPYCDVYKKYIIECLESINMQKHPNFEIVIFNDGGEDYEPMMEMVNKYNYVYLKSETNNGPGYSKWKFIEYCQKNTDKYSANDICVIVDGDDYLLQDNAFSIINNKYLDDKCWMTYGSFKGINEEQAADIERKDDFDYRKERWRYTHPRSYKYFFNKYFKETDFKYNGDWIKKCTDRQLIYNLLEWCRHSKIGFIKDKIYSYREHQNNSLKTVDKKYRNDALNSIINTKQQKCFNEEIHIVMCCWKRTKNLEQQVKMLNYQSTKQKIHFHLLNNNPDTSNTVKNIVNDCRRKYKNIVLHLSDYDNKYYGFQRFIYIRDVLLKKFLINYVIIIDDDQIFNKYWVENLWKYKMPKIYSGWYVKNWDKNLNYWKSKSKDNFCHYVGTGGSITDVDIFTENSLLWKIPEDLPSDVTVYNIEDLWLSYVAYKCGYTLYNSHLGIKCDMNKINKQSKDVSLYSTLKKEKPILLKYLSKKDPDWIK